MPQGFGGGRSPKSTIARVVHGAFPEAPRGKPARVPRPPATLPEGRREIWKKAARIVNARQVFCEGDELAFESLVAALAMKAEAEASLSAGGNRAMVYARPATKGGGTLIIERPEVRILAKADKAIAYWLSRFGLTPADRARVTAERPAEHIDEFLRR